MRKSTCLLVAGLAAAIGLALAVCEKWGAAAEEPAQGEVPLFDGLGNHGRKVTTASADAQRYFNQGLCFLYAFNHDEAIRSFRRAAAIDPKCAMAWWGIAVANGPHINNPIVSKENAQAAWEALAKAREAAAGAGPVEKELIAAIAKRYADPQPEDRKALDEAYAEAMRAVWKAHPEDADAGALFAESLMDLRPWDLWTAEGKTQPGTDEVVATLEAVLARTPDHPLALHLYIHAVEASPTPERAVRPADRLRNLQPGLGHLVHMPSHIDVRMGQWAQAIEANAKAIEADRLYREKSPQQGFYRIYMAHNHHMLSYAAIMRGESRRAIAAINDMARGIPPEFVKENALLVDGFTALPLEILVRFGRWDEILAAPEPPEFLPVARCMRHCARSIAFAAKKDVARARAERDEFLRARPKVAAEAKVGLNKAEDVLAVAEHLLAGEILYREGKVDDGIAELREAVRREDQLHYSEPPDWIHPVRHALGATLLAEGRAAEAEKVYLDDLKKLPENGWSLFGLARSLRVQQKNDQAKELEARFQKVWRDADIQISSSCLCQPGKDVAVAIETDTPELLGITGLTLIGKIQPHGKPTTYHFEYGPTQKYGQRTKEFPLPPRRTAFYRETWDAGWNGWSSWDARLQHFGEGGAEHGYIRYSGCPRDDHNHDDGIGTVHLAQYMYPGRIALSIPSAYLSAGDPDFRDARIKIAVRGVDWKPNGTELMWWSQSQSNIDLNPDDHTLHPGYIHANWCYTGTNLTDLLATGNWEQAEYQLDNNPHQWSYCGNVLPQTRYQYWSIDETQRHLNLDFFHMIVFVDPQNRPTGSIDFDEFEVAYRNYSLLSTGNGGKLVASPEGSEDDAGSLTDGWRNGTGKMWSSARNPAAPLQFEYEFTRPVTIRAAQVHQHPDWPSREIEILTSEDGQTWNSLLREEMVEKHPAGPNFAFLLKRGLDAEARKVKVRILSGYKPEHWGLGEIELFGDGAEMTTDDDWYHINTDITELRPGETCHYRLVAQNETGMTVGNDQVITMPADTKPQVLTGTVSRVTKESAKVEGRLNPLGKKTQFFFEYGRDASYGSKTPATYGGLQITPRTAFATLTGLEPNTEYHYRLVAMNETGTSHGADAVLRTK